MIKAIIIDDEPLARSIVREYIQSFPQISVMQECGDGFEGIKAIQHFKPELIFLDIQMPKINGFEMLELIEDPPAVIFTTAFDQFAIQAFESHAIDYLLKPFNKERFTKAVQKWLDQRQTISIKTQSLLETAAGSLGQNSRVVVKTGGKIKIIPVDDIQYLEAADDYVKIYTRTGNFLKNKTMSYFEKVLNPSQFIRTHRSFILNVQQIIRIDRFEKESHICVLQSGAQVPVSKSGYSRLKEVLGI